MPLTRWAAVAGVALAAAAWAAPLPAWTGGAFTAHMTRHLVIVAAAAPLLAFAVVGPAAAWPVVRRVAPLPASGLELAVVWVWHAPRLHHAAAAPAGFVLEQGAFLAAGVLFWLAIFGAASRDHDAGVATAVVALLLTLAHMTLLGALLSLAPRPLYGHGPDAMLDQQRGGTVMLAVSAVVYGGAGLAVAARLLGARMAPRVTP